MTSMYLTALTILVYCTIHFVYYTYCIHMFYTHYSTTLTYSIMFIIPLFIIVLYTLLYYTS